MKMKKFALRGLVILAVVVALCIFFSGTVRTLTTPKVRFAQAKMGKMETETKLTGKVVFPEVEELRIPVPEGVTLTVTRVAVSAGDRVKAGDTLAAAKVTDGEKNLESLRKESETAEKELRALRKKTGTIRLTRGELEWQEAWQQDAAARNSERDAWVEVNTSLRQAGLAMENGALPEAAGEEIQAQYEAWKEASRAAEAAADRLAGLERYAIQETTWTAMQQISEYEQKIADAEERMTALQVLIRTTEKITAPRAAYISEVSMEKGATVDGDTVILKMTAEGTNPMIRVDLSEVKQEISPGTTLYIESDAWSRPATKILSVGLNLDGHPYGDAEITSDVVYALGNVGAMMKEDVHAVLVTRSKDSTCLLPASAVRGSGDSRYVYTAEEQNSAFGGSSMKVRKTSVTVLAESGSTASVAEDLTYSKVLYMEDRALTEGGAVMEYTSE